MSNVSIGKINAKTATELAGFKLTQDNYFSPERPHVSNSQISDYLKDPAFYKARHIDKTIQFKVTDPMKRGSVVDAMLTQPDNNPYQMKVLKREDPELFELQKQMDDRFLLTPAYWDQAKAIAAHILKQPFWQAGLKDAEFQTVLEGEIEGVKVCGLTDRIDYLSEGKRRITDLKVVSAIKLDSPKKWHMNVVEMGYLRQAAIYRYLFSKMSLVPIENIEFCHAVGTQVQEGLCKVQLFKLSPHLMDMAMDEVKAALQGIKKKKFKSTPVEWDSVIEI
jgi:hypothetical protein